MASKNKLKKNLKLFDVFAISTGAMFSSGFFLLPGLAASHTGPSVILAYFLASILILPAMLSIAELSTAMPKAGGSYFFLDRGLGPRVGTISGLGIYLILVLKTAFALIGIGAYTAIFFDLPIKLVAICLTMLFMLLNIIGAKESANLQKIFVVILISVLGLFVLQGLYEIIAVKPFDASAQEFTPFLTEGWEGLIATTGFVFVSYIGLTKVASVAEEVQNPERNLPLGMILSLIVTTLFYVVGVFIIVALLQPEQLHHTLTPVAETIRQFSDWIPTQFSMLLIIMAAFAAFASTGNAGLLSASRYPLAMARDHILPHFFLKLGKFQTPLRSILLTTVLIILIILLVKEDTIAKLASAFQLFIFMLINFVVIVMRESRIQSYDPGFYSPLYPWMQIFGIVSSIGLVIMMGGLAVLFTVFIVLLGLCWYGYYVHKRTMRQGAIYHWFANLGQGRYDKLDSELRTILREKGLRESDPFDSLIAQSLTHDLDENVTTFEESIRRISAPLAQRVGIPEQEIIDGLLQGTQLGATPVLKGVALPHMHLIDLEHAEMALLRSQQGVELKMRDIHAQGEETMQVYAIIVLISPEAKPKQHLRILAQIAERVDDVDFMQNWLAAPNDNALREPLLSGNTYFTLHLQSNTPTGVLIGKKLSEIQLPDKSLVMLIQRGDEIITPRGDTVLLNLDMLTIMGDQYTTLMAINQKSLE